MYICRMKRKRINDEVTSNKKHKSAIKKDWVPLNIEPLELRCSMTLNNGQCFSWRLLENKSHTWIGVLDDSLILLKETNTDTMFCILSSALTPDKMKVRLYEYFQIDLGRLSILIPEWSSKDDYFKLQASHLTGLRLLEINPLECLLSFICSTNNNIKRIHNMVDVLRKEYGSKIGTSLVPALSLYIFV